MEHLSRLFRLARRTGDRLILTDEQDNGEPLVILPLNDYEVLVERMLNSTLSNPETPTVVRQEEGVPDEADVDEEALRDLWQEPGEKNMKKPQKNQETLKKSSISSGDGEERFYLEPIE